MRKVHRIKPTTSEQIKSTATYQSPFEAAARVSGGASQPSHTPWQEGAFLNLSVVPSELADPQVFLFTPEDEIVDRDSSTDLQVFTATGG